MKSHEHQQRNKDRGALEKMLKYTICTIAEREGKIQKYIRRYKPDKFIEDYIKRHADSIYRQGWTKIHNENI